jgi:hypothetical protein
MEDINNSPVEIYLSSIWQYHQAGVDRVLEALRQKQPNAQYSFNPELSWFKASCQAGEVRNVQAIFREVHDEMERSMGNQRVSRSSFWFRDPHS